jgi:hypothetical protein
MLDAIGDHLRSDDLPTPRACGIGIANPVVGDHVGFGVLLTLNKWYDVDAGAGVAV